MENELDSLEARTKLVKQLGKERYLQREETRAAMLAVPREQFVGVKFRKVAYEDRPLPIGQGQTISAPHMVAMMADALDASPGMKVLEVGSGCGYHAAVLAEIVGPRGSVVTIERQPQLVALATKNLRPWPQVAVILGDGSEGFPDQAPFDRISVACAARDVPSLLLDQLSDPGLLVVPVGTGNQELLRLELRAGVVSRVNLGRVVFVPLVDGVVGGKGGPKQH